MGLTQKREEHLKKMPIIESKITTSKNGRFLIHRTILTHIMPIDYYRAVLANTVKVVEEDLSDDEISEIIKEGREYLKAGE
ncbi:MAG: hypothetical protein WC916_04425 [Candidatus Woesearchaeota archaeon]